MELKYEFLYNQEAKQSLDKLFTADLHGQLLIDLNRLQRHYEKAFQYLVKEYQVLVDKHAERTDDGKIKEIAGPGTFKIKDDEMGEWNRAVSSLMAQTFEIEKLPKFHVGKLMNAGLNLSSVDLQNLEPILSGLDLQLEE